MARAGPAHHGHVGTAHDQELVFEMNVVRVLEDETGEMPERFFQRGWWAWDSEPLPADFTVPRTYCEMPSYRVGGLYVFFFRVEGGAVQYRFSSPRARLNGEVDRPDALLVRAIEAYLKVQRGPRAARREQLQRLLERAQAGGPLAPLAGDLEAALAEAPEVTAADRRAARLSEIDQLARLDPAEALRKVLALPERFRQGRADDLVARLRRDGVPAAETHLWRLPARHAAWVTESLPDLIPRLDSVRPAWWEWPSGSANLARWYAERNLAIPAALLEVCRTEVATAVGRRTWCDGALAKAGDEEVLRRAARWLEEGGGLRRHGPRAAEVFSLSPLPEAEVALRTLLTETLDRLAGLREAELSEGTRERRRRGFERLLKAWVWAQLEAPLASAEERLADFVEHLDAVPFTGCAVREVLEQRPDIADAVLARLDEAERGLLDACLLYERPEKRPW
ncbi:MAG: hypothetical protein AAGK22_00860 [Acidobacteriota bacterium]